MNPGLETLERRLMLAAAVAVETVTVMSQNLYLGADLAPLMNVKSLLDVPRAVTQVWNAVKATPFPARAKALAREIEANKPDVLALQEASLWRRQTPGDSLSAHPKPATKVVYDYVGILTGELKKHGLTYKVVSATNESDLELPDSKGSDIRLTDRDVILARAGLAKESVTFSNAHSGHFSAKLRVPASGAAFSSIRGWAAIDVNDHGHKFRVVDAHLEEESSGAIQVAQARELVLRPGDTKLPTLFVGDFNSRGNDAGSATHANLLAAGFADAWEVTHAAQSGFTWGQAANLKNADSTLSQRLDFVLYRHGPQAVSMKVVGDKPTDRTSGGLWPSDHAGIVVKLGLS